MSLFAVFRNMIIYFSNQTWEFLILGWQKGRLFFRAQKNLIRSCEGIFLSTIHTDPQNLKIFIKWSILKIVADSSRKSFYRSLDGFATIFRNDLMMGISKLWGSMWRVKTDAESRNPEIKHACWCDFRQCAKSQSLDWFDMSSCCHNMRQRRCEEMGRE